MPDSFCHLAAHIVFSTRNRKRYLHSPQQEEMHAYLAGIINKLGGKALKINGTEDHVHILCLLPKELSPADFMARVKANSSKWYREKHSLEFQWQDGYAMYSVSKSRLPEVEKYITGQKEHHFNISAWEEFDAMLKRHSGADSDGVLD
ncbi:MAG TPA: IS200/IS605 family transposase [Candidatus Syntrophosphaera sp.]|jgi:REP element-mobilizing transposase RayT|nr:IS200/IS605 family transposase [Candidatus Syntrophosphaera sp.]